MTDNRKTTHYDDTWSSTNGLFGGDRLSFNVFRFTNDMSEEAYDGRRAEVDREIARLNTLREFVEDKVTELEGILRDAQSGRN